MSRSPKELKEAREATGLLMAEAARLTETPYRTWQNWEDGKRRVPGWPFSWFEMYRKLHGGSK